MPRNVRNLWMEIHINGRVNPLVGGPASADGQTNGVIYIRHKGGVWRLGSINQSVNMDNQVVFNFWLDSDLINDKDTQFEIGLNGIRIITERDTPKERPLSGGN